MATLADLWTGLSLGLRLIKPARHLPPLTSLFAGFSVASLFACPVMFEVALLYAR